MAITLTPEQERQVRHIAELRGFADVESYLTELVNQTYDQELFFAENREEISAMIEEGWQEAERGEFFTPEQVKAALEDAKREFHAQRSAA